jgi:hypothetical protein
MHDHDALTFMYREEDEDIVIPKLFEALVVPVPLAQGRTLKIPYDCEVGWNKAHASATNPDGLRAYTPGDANRRRQPIRNLVKTIMSKPMLRVSRG